MPVTHPKQETHGVRETSTNSFMTKNRRFRSFGRKMKTFLFGNVEGEQSVCYNIHHIKKELVYPI